MKNNVTVTIRNQNELAGFIRSIGTECQFVSMITETEVKMRKTANPYVGAVKRSNRNGLVNINYVAACQRNLTEINGVKTEYVAGATWYVHELTDDGKSLALCVHKTDTTKFYLQYFPHRTLGKNEFYLNGVKMSAEEVTKMKTFISEKEESAFKPTVITLAMSSIRRLKARKVTMNNNTVSKIMNRLASFKNVPAKIDSTPVPVAA